MNNFLGIDVGTGSARAGIFNAKGQLLGHHVQNIQTWKPESDYVEQSSNDIWNAICECTQVALKEAKVSANSIKGIGFDATCSLVLVDTEGNPVSVDFDGDDQKNIVVWMDHRALVETASVNALKDNFPVFDYVGGSISPEMQIPKLLWIKKNLPQSWKRTAHFFDLPDYLTYRATGELTRSLCSTTCKWTYLPSQEKDEAGGWHEGFFKAVGLEDFVEEEFARIGRLVRPMGEPIGSGLSLTAAKEMGLLEGTSVGVSIIDAHAGGIGMIGLSEGDPVIDFDRRLALIGGTSSCHMAASFEKRLISGVWGPYYSSMIPNMWLNEGGQSATGSLVDHVIFNHAAYSEANAEAEKAHQSIYEFLNNRLTELSCETLPDTLTESTHVCPYFHGNRSPRANPYLTGMITGLKLSASIDDLARLYLATIQAIAYGTRHIIEAMNATGYKIDTLVCCGGGTKNPVFLQQHANATNCRLIIPEEPEAVLLGSAMLGAVASGQFEDLPHAMAAMSRPNAVIEPQSEIKMFHDSKYKVFHRLYADQQAYAEIMS